jgi:hypothetical protein
MRRADLYTALALVALFVTVSATAPRWSRLLRQPARSQAIEEEGVPVTAPTAPPGQTPVVGSINVKLFFEDTQAGGLVVEQRSVSYQSSLARQIQVVVEEILRGSQAGNLSSWTSGGRVLEVFVTPKGVAYVDLSKEVKAGLMPGTRAELLAVYSLVDSISLNFPAIKRVQILIDGLAVETLAGHVDLSRPLGADLTLLAPVPEPNATPTPPSS